MKLWVNNQNAMSKYFCFHLLCSWIILINERTNWKYWATFTHQSISMWMEILTQLDTLFYAEHFISFFELHDIQVIKLWLSVHGLWDTYKNRYWLSNLNQKLYQIFIYSIIIRRYNCLVWYNQNIIIAKSKIICKNHVVLHKNEFRLLNLSCETSFLILILVEIMVGTNEALG